MQWSGGRATRLLAFHFLFFAIGGLLLSCSFRPAGIDKSGRALLRSVAWTANPNDLWVVQGLVDEFNRLHPDIYVQHEVIEQGYDVKLLTSFAAGNAPDLFWVSSGISYPYIKRGLLYDLTPFIEKDGLDLKDFYPSTLAPYFWDGRYFGLPNDACSTVLFYNKDLFEKAGLPEPTAGWLWDEFLAAARALSQDTDGNGRTDQWGFVLPSDIYLIFPWVYSNRGLIFDPQDPDRPLFTEPAAIEAFNRAYGLALEKHVAPLRGQSGDGGYGGSGARRGFQLGRYAMMVSGWWDMTDTDEYAPDLNYAVVPYPVIQDPASLAYSTATAVSAFCPHPELAWEFVKFMTGKEGQLIRCKARMAGPSRRSVAKDPYFDDRPMDRVFLDAMEYSRAAYGNNHRIMMNEMAEAQDRILQEIQTTEEAFKKAERNYYRRCEEE